MISEFFHLLKIPALNFIDLCYVSISSSCISAFICMIYFLLLPFIILFVLLALGVNLGCLIDGCRFLM